MDINIALTDDKEARFWKLSDELDETLLAFINKTGIGKVA